jgi:hypothetical protein
MGRETRLTRLESEGWSEGWSHMSVEALPIPEPAGLGQVSVFVCASAVLKPVALQIYRVLLRSEFSSEHSW